MRKKKEEEEKEKGREREKQTLREDLKYWSIQRAHNRGRSSLSLTPWQWWKKAPWTPRGRRGRERERERETVLSQERWRS